jgi:hypothetical protein
VHLQFLILDFGGVWRKTLFMKKIIFAALALAILAIGLSAQAAETPKVAGHSHNKVGQLAKHHHKHHHKKHHAAA